VSGSSIPAADGGRKPAAPRRSGSLSQAQAGSQAVDTAAWPGHDRRHPFRLRVHQGANPALWHPGRSRRLCPEDRIAHRRRQGQIPSAVRPIGRPIRGWPKEAPPAEKPILDPTVEAREGFKLRRTLKPAERGPLGSRSPHRNRRRTRDAAAWLCLLGDMSPSWRLVSLSAMAQSSPQRRGRGGRDADRSTSLRRGGRCGVTSHSRL
jgi:hypothetical protein